MTENDRPKNIDEVYPKANPLEVEKLLKKPEFLAYAGLYEFGRQTCDHNLLSIPQVDALASSKVYREAFSALRRHLIINEGFSEQDINVARKSLVGEVKRPGQ